MRDERSENMVIGQLRGDTTRDISKESCEMAASAHIGA